ncbi:MAG: Archaeal histone A1 [Candidatus Syntrophoarchaeum sp. GoM_oil]|nr:MAG: Archaeal histone A1 [Candidatus Syntrophoarchaeum sp. GoM_oil]
MAILPIAPVDRLVREAGADRVSEGAREALAKILEDQGMKIAKEAIKLAEHAGRKTVKIEDIELASSRV